MIVSAHGGATPVRGGWERFGLQVWTRVDCGTGLLCRGPALAEAVALAVRLGRPQPPSNPFLLRISADPTQISPVQLVHDVDEYFTLLLQASAVTER